MDKSEFKRIKEKIRNIDPGRWWGDDYDVRFYLIHKLKQIKNKSVLDVGGGIGIISSELDKSNFRVNLDSSFDDLKKCKNYVDADIETICASMTNLPFVEQSFDHLICANVLEVAKSYDVKSNNVKSDNSVKVYPNVDRILSESNTVLNPKGVLFITTPNNAYYKSNKMNYYELKKAITKIFSEHKLRFYNPFPKLSNKSRKLNLANVIPKFMSKILSGDTILKKMLVSDSGIEKSSVSFYIEATK